MTISRALLALAVAVAFAGMIAVGIHSQHVLEDGLPPRVECETALDAWIKAGPSAIPVLGTGSMAPYIPASAPGADPHKTVVAYVAPVRGATYSDITPGALCVYRYQSAPGVSLLVIHGAAQKDSAGWIMSGLHNAHSESWARVTPENFVALVGKTYVWKQP